ncbi:MAG TPA: hypothetical protein VK419_00490 [Bryobacteraceae bacterium]|nr:hypothetical protein [Bryobacteraceae bacterium]
MLRRLLALFLFATPLFCAEIELRYAAIERIIADQMFTQDGRHYMRGNKTTRCQFAYLEGPHLASDGGRLRVGARFSGRSAVDLFNRCVGLGDSFDLTITAIPFPRDGAIALREVKVTSPKDSYYIRRVRAALAQSIAKDFKIEIRDQARRLLEPAHEGAPYKQELAGFDLNEIRITPEALVLVIDFRIVVK